MSSLRVYPAFSLCDVLLTVILREHLQRLKKKSRSVTCPRTLFLFCFFFDEILHLFSVFQQYSKPFVFRADTLCCWSDGSVLSRFLLRNHCRVGTFIRIDFCVFSSFLFQSQSSEVWCFHTRVEFLSVFFLVIAQVTWKCGSYSLVVTCTSDRCLDTETRVLFTTQSRNRTSTESDKYSQW